MVKISLDSIIKSIKNIGSYYRISEFDKPYVDTLKRGEWVDDGTGRGLQCHLDGVDYYIIFSQIRLTPSNKVYDYNAFMDVILKRDNKYEDELFSHRITLELSGKLK